MPLKNERKFGKDKYQYWNPYKKKSEAKQVAKGLRRQGHHARVIPGKDCYRVYYS